jgi:hypothetical protein
MTEAVIRNKPGMASVKDMPILQDGPPPGGFAPVRFARRIPNKGPSAMAIFLAAFGAFSYGMYQVGQGNKVRRWKGFFLSLKILDCFMVLASVFFLISVGNSKEMDFFHVNWIAFLNWRCLGTLNMAL